MYFVSRLFYVSRSLGSAKRESPSKRNIDFRVYFAYRDSFIWLPSRVADTPPLGSVIAFLLA